IIIPVVPDLIESLGKIDTSEASMYNGWLAFAYSVMLFIFSPVMGALSDRFGRRPVLLFSLLGLGLDYIIQATAPDLFWLFTGRVIAGIMGASFTTATAYIADISPPEKRAQNFGMVGMAFGLGFIIGPLIGAIFSKWGARVPFIAASVFTLLNLVYGFFFLPESLSKENRRTFEWKRANPIGAFKQVSKYPMVKAFILPVALMYIAHYAVQSGWNYYTKVQFNWGADMVGYSLAFVGLVIGIVQGGLIRIILPKLGQKRSVFAGLIFTFLGFVLFGIANQGWQVFAILIPYGLGGIAGPAIQGMMSNEVAANEQGELQGIMSSLMSLTAIIGPLMMSYIFSFFTSKASPVYFPGAAMIAGALLIIVAFILMVPVLKKLKSEEKK
ncbi:MAG: TCR/Tet family MFS transporter, partial [Bacteroidia bacterium]|nr:TCR/Tet family MFS transporter [Bacteroidia bacterium]